MRLTRRSREEIDGFLGRLCAALGHDAEPGTLERSIEAEFEAHPGAIGALQEMAKAVEMDRLFRRCGALRKRDGAARAVERAAGPPPRPVRAAKG